MRVLVNVTLRRSLAAIAAAALWVALQTGTEVTVTYTHDGGAPKTAKVTLGQQ